MPRWPYKSDTEYIAGFKAKCTITEKGCWQWPPLKRQVKGPQYPSGSYRHKNWRLNRLMVTLTQRPLAGRHEHACHTCDNHLCINPDHLWIGSNQENLLDASRKGRMPGQAKTHCLRGHEFTPENTYWSMRNNGITKRRHCRTCQRESQRRRPIIKETGGSHGSV